MSEARPHVATAVVEVLDDAVRQRHEDEAAGHAISEFGRGYETGLAMAALTLGVEEAASPQRETQLPAWLAAHGGEEAPVQVQPNPEQVQPNG